LRDKAEMDGSGINENLTTKPRKQEKHENLEGVFADIFLQKRKKCLTGMEKAFSLISYRSKKGIYNNMMHLWNNIIVIIRAVGVVLSLLLLLVGVIDLRRQGLVMT
jgi:hypothetical protein